jgi:hypothetical protein
MISCRQPQQKTTKHARWQARLVVVGTTAQSGAQTAPLLQAGPESLAENRFPQDCCLQEPSAQMLQACILMIQDTAKHGA